MKQKYFLRVQTYKTKTQINFYRVPTVELALNSVATNWVWDSFKEGII